MSLTREATNDDREIVDERQSVGLSPACRAFVTCLGG
jgi:hypothetical protein